MYQKETNKEAVVKYILCKSSKYQKQIIFRVIYPCKFPPQINLRQIKLSSLNGRPHLSRHLWQQNLFFK